MDDTEFNYIPLTNPKSEPHVCPVCNGRGEVAEWFYYTQDTTNVSTALIPCRSCSGSGVIISSN